ncbi:MAG: succinate dehydrogenase cytochrome b subunit [Desulfobacterales bacterium]|nr:succinate dehydrogenase cytochrome b subunit [Desulfobacterales bacterium]
MNTLSNAFTTSIGKKLLMAVTGLGFCIFLLTHLLGNLTLYVGRETFESYVEHLHALDPLIRVAEIGLLAFLLVHVITGTLLFIQNRKARPERYAVNKSGGGRTIGSATAPYTGFLILLFIIFHLLNFHFVEHPEGSVFNTVSNTFSNAYYTGIYIVAMIVVAVHVRHGFWSLFQTLGANHPKYMPVIQGAGIVFALLLGAGFGLIPPYIGLGF